MTERLLLRPYVINDVTDIHAVLYVDPDGMRFIGGAADVHQAGRRVARYIAQQASVGYAFWPVIDRHAGAIVGEAGLIPLGDEGPDIELGYAFGVALWGAAWQPRRDGRSR